MQLYMLVLLKALSSGVWICVCLAHPIMHTHLNRMEVPIHLTLAVFQSHLLSVLIKI